MPVFTSAEDLYAVVAPFLCEVMLDDAMRARFVTANTSFLVNYEEPVAALLLDATVDPPVIVTGDEARSSSPEVQLFMSGDDGHKFWLGDLNIPIAMAKRKVRTSGNLTRMLGLLPALKPAYAHYRAYLDTHGHRELLPDTV